MSVQQNPDKIKYESKGYSEAEVEILTQIASMKVKLDIVTEDYVKRAEFEPVQRLVYGLVGLVLTAVFIAVIALVINGGA